MPQGPGHRAGHLGSPRCALHPRSPQGLSVAEGSDGAKRAPAWWSLVCAPCLLCPCTYFSFHIGLAGSGEEGLPGTHTHLALGIFTELKSN